MTTRFKPLLTLAALTLLALPGIAHAAGCPNEEFRTGPSASLPDCRAYELVTPEELGRSQAMTFTVDDHAIASTDGEHLALRTLAPLEPDPDLDGTRTVFSRTAQGWTAKSVVPPGAAGRELDLELLSPDLSQVAFALIPELNEEERLNAPRAFEVGPVGGPYALVANIPGENRSFFSGANAGTKSVPAFTDVLFESTDHQLLPQGRERKLAEEAIPGTHDLYEWTAGRLRLVNVEGEGENLKLINKCGVYWDQGPFHRMAQTCPAPSQRMGSRIFFRSPEGEFSPCGPPRLYMRADDRETVESGRRRWGRTV